MVCIEVYTRKGKRTLGQSIEDFMSDQSLWPESLRTFFFRIPSEDRPKGFTYAILLQWMAQEASIPQLAYPEYSDRFIKLLGRYKSWANNPEASGGENLALLTAISRCGIVRNTRGQVVTNTAQLIALLYGRDNLDDDPGSG